MTGLLRILAAAVLILCPPWRLSARGDAERGTGAPAARVFVDDLGHSLSLRGQPERIISGTLTSDEILLSLVAPQRLLAVTRFSRDPAISNVAEPAARVPQALDLNVEAYIALQPDLVFLAAWSKAESVQQLRDAGLAVYQLRSPLSLGEIKEKVHILSRLVGAEARGDELLGWMESRERRLAEAVGRLKPGQRLRVMDYQPGGTSCGRGSSWQEMVRLAGLENAVSALEADRWGVVPVSKEKLLEADADILVLPGWIWADPEGADRFRRQILSDPALGGLKAVRMGRVLQMPERLKTATSHFFLLGAEALCRYAYPELLPE